MPNDFDINKPISSALDLDDTSVEPVSDISTGGLDILDITDDELLKYSHNAENGEIYPQRKTPVLPKMFQKPHKPSKVDLGKPEKATQMPAVRAENTNQPAVPTPQKVDLGKPEKAAQMPAIRADGSQPPVIPWKSGESKPNYSGDFRKGTPPERQFLGRGTVNFAMTDKKNVILTAVSVIAVLLLMALLHRFISAHFESGSRNYLKAVSSMIGFGVILLTFLITLIRSGEHWQYNATGREIIFSRRGRASYIIFYKDVLAVDYAPYKFLGMIESGYLVTVLAYGKRYEFKYVFPNLARKLPFDYTPFEIIRKQIDQLGINHNA